MTRQRQPNAGRIPPEGDPKRYVFTEAPKCSHCGSTKLRVYGKMPPDEAGTVRRYAQCATCRGKFMLVENAGPAHFEISDGLPLIYVPPIRCPRCSSVQVKPYCSRDRGDGTNKRYTQCLDCALRFIVIVPRTGKRAKRERT